MEWVEALDLPYRWQSAGRSGRSRPAARLRRDPASGVPRFDGRDLSDAMRQRYSADTGLLRRLFASRALSIPLDSQDRDALQAWLGELRLRLEPTQPGAEAPRLLAGRTGGLPAPYEVWLSTALVEFLVSPASGEIVAGVRRCHGVGRGPAPPLGWTPAQERAFALAAGLGEVLDGETFHQCPRLLHAPRGGRFCGKACGNANFAARKRQRDPRYFADKQQRYRDRSERRRRDGARLESDGLVFID